MSGKGKKRHKSPIDSSFTVSKQQKMSNSVSLKSFKNEKGDPTTIDINPGTVASTSGTWDVSGLQTENVDVSNTDINDNHRIKSQSGDWRVTSLKNGNVNLIDSNIHDTLSIESKSADCINDTLRIGSKSGDWVVKVLHSVVANESFRMPSKSGDWRVSSMQDEDVDLEDVSDDILGIISKLKDWSAVSDLLKKRKNKDRPNNNIFAGSQDVLNNALYQAVLQDNVFVTQFLLFKGSSMSTYVKKCLHVACERGNFEMVELISKSFSGHALTSFLDTEGNTPLHVCQRKISASKIIECLLNHGIDVNAKNRKGETALMKAVQHKNLAGIISLIRNGADIYVKDKNGDSAATMAEQVELKEFMEFVAVDIHEVHATSLIRAVKEQHIQMILLLLLSGYSDIDDKDKFVDGISCGDTALTALFNSKLKEKDPNETDFGRNGYLLRWKSYGLKDKFDDVVNNMEYSGYLKHKDYQNSTILPFTDKEKSIFVLLINQGASIFEEGRYEAGNSPLVMTCELENLDLLKYILRHNIYISDDLDYEAQMIARALLVAVKRGRTDFIEELSPLVRRVYGKKSVISRYFKYVLHSAIEIGQMEIVSLLIELFEDYNVYDAIKKVIEFDHVDIYKMLCLKEKDKFKYYVQEYDFITISWLSNACKNDNIVIAEHLFSSGMKGDLQGALRESKSGRMVKLLLDNGAVLDKDTNYPSILDEPTSIGEYLLMLFWQHSFLDCLKVILKYGPQHGLRVKMSFLMKLVRGRLHVFKDAGGKVAEGEMRKLFSRYFPVKESDINSQYKGRLLLSEAVHSKFWGLAETLLKKGADPKLKSDKDQNIIINEVIMHEKDAPKRIDLLLEYGADINQRDVAGHGCTPLMGSVCSKKLNCLVHLIELGADVTLTNDFNQNILSFIISKSSNFTESQLLRVIKLVLNCNADVSTTLSLTSLYPFILNKSWTVFLEYIHSGRFTPVNMHFIFESEGPPNRNSDEFFIRDAVKDLIPRLTTPFGIALACNNIIMATYLFKVQFLTYSDYFIAENLVEVKHFLENVDSVANFLKKVKSHFQYPPSLYRLAIARVSDLVGPRPGRRSRVNQLELPFPLGDVLLFQSANQLMAKRKVLSAITQVPQNVEVIDGDEDDGDDLQEDEDEDYESYDSEDD